MRIPRDHHTTPRISKRPHHGLCEIVGRGSEEGSLASQPARTNLANIEVGKQDVGIVKRALLRMKDADCAFKKALRTAVGAEEGNGKISSKRTDEDDSNPTGGERTFPQLGEESAGEEEREVEIEVKYSSCFIL